MMVTPSTVPLAVIIRWVDLGPLGEGEELLIARQGGQDLFQNDEIVPADALLELIKVGGLFIFTSN